MVAEEGNKFAKLCCSGKSRLHQKSAKKILMECLYVLLRAAGFAGRRQTRGWMVGTEYAIGSITADLF